MHLPGLRPQDPHGGRSCTVHQPGRATSTTRSPAADRAPSRAGVHLRFRRQADPADHEVASPGAGCGPRRWRKPWLQPGHAARRSRRRCAAIGPTVSRDGASGSTPSSGTRPRLVFSPATPQQAAGIRIEPPVSLPKATSASPAPTATAEPLDEPPGTKAGVERVDRRPEPRVDPGHPEGQLVQVGLADHRDGRRRPRRPGCRPGRRRRRQLERARAAMTFEPLVVGTPTMSMRSLTASRSPVGLDAGGSNRVMKVAIAGSLAHPRGLGSRGVALPSSGRLFDEWSIIVRIASNECPLVKRMTIRRRLYPLVYRTCVRYGAGCGLREPAGALAGPGGGPVRPPTPDGRARPFPSQGDGGDSPAWSYKRGPYRPPVDLARRRPGACPTPSCTATPTSASSTGPPTRRSWSRRRPVWAWRPWPSPITTACTGWSVSPRRPGRWGCRRCSAPSCPWG